MLHLGQQNHVAGAEKFSTPSLSDQIDALSRAAGEDDFIRAFCSDEISHPLPRFFVMLGRPRAQRVQAAMHIGVFVFVIIADHIEDSARLLRAGRVVEVNQRMPVHALAQDRKILTKRGPIHAISGCLMHQIICSMR